MGLGKREELLTDLRDYPPDQDVFACISRVRSKPFDADFDAQAEAAEALYGLQLHFSFIRKDAAGELEFIKEVYGERVYRRAEQILFGQMGKYRLFFHV